MCAMTELFAQCEPLNTRSDQTEVEIEDSRFGFNVVGKQQRPAEFVQCWLDLVRVQFEPNPPGTMFLNSNWDLIASAVPNAPFQLAYISLTGSAEGGAEALVRSGFALKLTELGCPLSESHACFVALCVGHELFARRMMVTRDLHRVLGAGFTVDRALEAISGVASGQETDLTGADRQVHAGVALDPHLPEGVMRISAWLFMPQRRTH
jgi:hypothetical protein